MVVSHIHEIVGGRSRINGNTVNQNFLYMIASIGSEGEGGIRTELNRDGLSGFNGTVGIRLNGDVIVVDGEEGFHQSVRSDTLNGVGLFNISIVAVKNGVVAANHFLNMITRGLSQDVNHCAVTIVDGRSSGINDTHRVVVLGSGHRELIKREFNLNVGVGCIHRHGDVDGPFINVTTNHNRIVVPNHLGKM